MPITRWNQVIVDGKNWLEIDVAKLRVPLEWDPSSGVFLLVAAPDGGIFNHPALLQGDDGQPPDIDTTINFTSLAWDDPTPEFASWTETSPNVYKLNLGLRKGQPGDEGIIVLDPADYGTPVAGRMLQVKSDLSAFEYAAVPIAGRYLPASIASVPSGNPSYTLAPVPMPAQARDWYPNIRAQTVITGTGSDVRADLIARLSTSGVVNGETAGPIVGRGFGGVGVNAAGLSTVISSARPAGSAPTYGKVLAGNTATVYVRVERQAGGGTFTTDDDTTIIEVGVDFVP